MERIASGIKNAGGRSRARQSQHRAGGGVEGGQPMTDRIETPRNEPTERAGHDRKCAEVLQRQSLPLGCSGRPGCMEHELWATSPRGDSCSAPTRHPAHKAPERSAVATTSSAIISEAVRPAVSSSLRTLSHLTQTMEAHVAVIEWSFHTTTLGDMRHEPEVPTLQASHIRTLPARCRGHCCRQASPALRRVRMPRLSHSNQRCDRPALHPRGHNRRHPASGINIWPGCPSGRRARHGMRRNNRRPEHASANDVSTSRRLLHGCRVAVGNFLKEVIQRLNVMHAWRLDRPLRDLRQRRERDTGADGYLPLRQAPLIEPRHHIVIHGLSVHRSPILPVYG